MSVQFHEESGEPLLYSRLQRSAQPPKMILALINSGIVQDERQARYVYLLIIIVLIFFSAFLLSTMGPPDIKDQPDPSLVAYHLS